ncbi:transmembrane protein, putative (macronuclear) [Tetrahymena thermophila SB210]|uniref:Transmembrane protein, putative n=1 Tax=Tetrahymena thermophila (strain SB210) TaxID=312017 RepID=W7X7K9_TETTS|nr:transmembrane protein, putative [Tetrahymena thermophila SB210]EWS72378.1 transmembrane protein, putative [Tetrahymena thermophila SB210]|eukprot:XP_012655100.1 transmembrane protein, putative [Tetrahymena thermophila SB210]
MIKELIIVKNLFMYWFSCQHYKFSSLISRFQIYCVFLLNFKRSSLILLYFYLVLPCSCLSIIQVNQPLVMVRYSLLKVVIFRKVYVKIKNRSTCLYWTSNSI